MDTPLLQVGPIERNRARSYSNGSSTGTRNGYSAKKRTSQTSVLGISFETQYNSLVCVGCLGLLFAVALNVKGDSEGLSLITLELIAAFSLAVANGGNDIANAVGTSVGSGALSMQQALGLGCCFEFAGAVILGSLVSKTISKGVIEPNEFSSEPGVFAALMFSVVVGAALTTLLATIYGYPISATHGIVSGLVAVGWHTKGSACVGWGKLPLTIIMWVLSPVLGLVASMLLQVLCSSLLTLDFNAGIGPIVVQLLWTLTFTVTCLFMFMTGPEAIRISHVPTAIAFSTAFGVMLTIARFTIRWLQRLWSNMKNLPNKSHHYKKRERRGVPLTPMGTNYKSDFEAGGVLHKSLREEDGITDITGKEDPIPEEDAKFEVIETDLDKYSENENEFVGLLVLSALTVAFAHGANDVGNAVGPLAVMMEVLTKTKLNDVPEVPVWCLVLGAFGFIIGILTLGKYTITTVGRKIIRLTPSTSYATQMGAALAVLVSSALGMPVSTSHCLVGSVIGVGYGQIFMAYINSSAPPAINYGVINKIVLGWVLTIPLAMLVSLVAFSIAGNYAQYFAPRGI